MYFIHHWCQYWVNKVLLNLPRRSHQQVSRSATRATLIMRRFARMGFVSVRRTGDSIYWPFNTLGSLAHYMLCSIPQWLSVETARSPAYCSVHHPGKPEDGAGQPHFNDTRCVLISEGLYSAPSQVQALAAEATYRRHPNCPTPSSPDSRVQVPVK